MVADESHDDKTQSFLALTSGTSVLHYKILEKIGSGGMGEVYLALDTKLNRKVALKFLPPHLCRDDDCRKRFTREAQAAAKLDHPNIVPVYEVGEFKERPFFAMAHIEGRSLREIIKEGKLSISDAIGFTMQICEGLHKAHESGVVHRDIKPSNVIIDAENRARIVDFGLATVSGEEKLTKTGSTLGTVGYMSPEQVEGKQVDQRSDLFSVGVILYEMLTGRRPFEGETDAAVGHAITSSTPEPIARYKSGTTGELQQIVDKALTKDPTLRYQHADGMLSDLKRLAIGAIPAKRSRLGLWAAMVAVIVIVAGYFLIDRYEIASKSDGAGWDNSVAVLIFRDLSQHQDQAIFCEGMTEEIIGRLGTIRGLKVTSTQSVIRFRGADHDLKSIGRELGVANILEGSIQIIGDDIRVRAQLIRVEDDAHIWTEKYDRAMEDLFAIQDEISRSIAEVLETRLVVDGASIASRHGTDDIEAYNAYVRGRHFFRNRIDDDLVKAIEQFEIAIDLDPDYAQAWSGLADAWWVRPQYGNVTEKVAFPKVDSAARIALELGPDLAEAHASWSHALSSVHGRYEEEERALLRAIDLNPGYSWAHMWYGNYLHRTGGDPLLELKHLKLAVELDPVSVPALGNLAFYYRRQGDLEEAERLGRRQITLEPTYINAYRNLAYVLLRQGDTTGVRQTLDSMMHYAPDVWQAHARKGDLLLSLGMREEAEVAYREAVALAPDNWQPHHELGVFLTETMHEYREGDSCFLKAIALDATQPLPHSRYGHSLRLQGRTDEMVEHLRIAVELAPYDPEMYRSYGWAIGPGFGQYEEAIEYMQKALELNPRHTRTLTSISLMYAYERRYDEAHAAINKSIELDQGYAFALRRKADIFVMAGEYDSALAWYSRYHTCHPTDLYALNRLMSLNSQLGRYEAADSCLEILVSFPDPNTRAWARRITVRPLYSQGKISAAIAQLEDGIRADSLELGACADILYKYDYIIDLKLLFSRDHNSTLEYVDRAKRLSAAVDSRTAWQDAVMVAYEGLALAKAGEARHGIRMIRDALNNPEFTAAEVKDILWHYLARAYLTSGQFDEALDMMRRPLRQDSTFLNQMFLGYTFLLADRLDSATVWLESALDTWDEDRLINAHVEQVLARYYLGQAYEGAGQTKEAIEQYEIFLDIWKDADEGLEPLIDARERLAKLKHGI